MNKTELSEIIAAKIGISKKQALESIELMLETITNTIKAGGEVTLTGFGAFSARSRKGRVGVNPQNPKEPITIPSVVVPKFKAGKALKDTLKGKIAAPKAIVAETPTEPLTTAPQAPTEPTSSTQQSQ